MRLPFLQVSQEEMARARTMAGYLAIPYAQALGMTVALKSAALELASDVDVSGVIDDPNPPEWVAVQCGWPLEQAEVLTNTMVRCGFVMAGPQGGYAVANMEPYAKALATSRKRSEAGRRGAAARKSRGGYGRAMAGPQQSDGHDMTPDAKKQTQKQTYEEKKPAAQGDDFASHDDLPDATSDAQSVAENELTLTPSSDEKPRKRPQRAQGDARHAALVVSLVQAFSDARRAAYGFQGGRDAKAVTELLALADQDVRTAGDAAPAEILRRWKIALAWEGFPSCSTLGDLKRSWNYYAESQVRRTTSVGFAPPSMDWSEPIP